MSTNKDRIDLAVAQAIAEEVKALLSPACLRIEIAGSIRRRSPTVGDIELLAEPITTTVPIDLFGEVTETEDALDNRVRTFLANGTFRYRLDRNGREAVGLRYKRMSYRDIGLDLFSCLPPAQWGLLLAIRTGPGEFSHQLVTPRHMGGLLPDGYNIRDGQLWHGFDSVPVPDEEVLFHILGMEFIRPEERREDWKR